MDNSVYSASILTKIICNNTARIMDKNHIVFPCLEGYQFYPKHDLLKDIIKNAYMIFKSISSKNNKASITSMINRHPHFANLQTALCGIEGYTLLHVLAEKKSDNITVALLLIENHANANIKNNDGQTALDLAIENNNPHLSRLLLQYDHFRKISIKNTDINAYNLQGQTILNRAIKLQLPAKSIDYFLKYKGINVNKPDNDGKAALHHAAQTGNVDLIKQLINPGIWAQLRHYNSTLRGADINLQDTEGNTALHYAALYDKNEIIPTLTDNGFSFNIQNNEGYTALDIAKSSENSNIVKILQDAARPYVSVPGVLAEIGNTGFISRFSAISIIFANPFHRIIAIANYTYCKLCYKCIS